MFTLSYVNTRARLGELEPRPKGECFHTFLVLQNMHVFT